MSEVGAFLRLWDRRGDFVDLVAEDEPRVDAAVEQWVSSGGTRDGVVDLTRVDGDSYKIVASFVAAWTLSTPDGRRRTWEWEKAGLDERAEMRAAAGFPYEGES